MKIVKRILVFLLIVLIIMQFFGPDKNEGDIASIDAFIADTNPPQSVHETLKNACFDCHSDFTRYPWYNNITPVNYWIDGHIDHGKGHFDVSKWDSYSTKKKDHKLEELIEMVEDKTMPLNSYTWTHGDARLTDAQIKDMVEWAKGVRIKYSLEPKPE
ncbi:heme-binding domain-containing protein [Winogradskyella sp. 3972H.M.0a.05]|uniref:heme-binding domain-containing protein n=1 Tax=Winogradskyella sp. 3972H.M.0a.05 TaxID=2950277 RepID=UPI0033912C98